MVLKTLKLNRHIFERNHNPFKHFFEVTMVSGKIRYVKLQSQQRRFINGVKDFNSNKMDKSS